MKNIQDVLREKQTEIEKLTREIKLLRVAASILEDEGQSVPSPDTLQRHADMATVSLEESLLDVVPAAGAANGDANKPWP